MRPEYVEAVDAVRFGGFLWLIFLLPAAIIWYAVLTRSVPNVGGRVVLGYSGFPLACIVFWGLAAFHVNHIQSTKLSHAITDAEFIDYSSDTWATFAPVTVIPVALVFCMVNLIFANLALAIIKWCYRWQARRRASRPLKGDEV